MVGLEIPRVAARTREEGTREALNQNCRSQVLLVFDDTVVGEAARTTRDPAAPFRTT